MNKNKPKDIAILEGMSIRTVKTVGYELGGVVQQMLHIVKPEQSSPLSLCKTIHVLKIF